MAALTLLSVGLAGLIGPLGATAAGGDEFDMSEGDLLLFQNGTASQSTVTLVAVDTTAQVIGGFPVAVANKAFVIPAGESALIPVSGSNMSAYFNKTTKKVSVTYTGHGALLKAAVIRKG